MRRTLVLTVVLAVLVGCATPDARPGDPSPSSVVEGAEGLTPDDENGGALEPEAEPVEPAEPESAAEPAEPESEPEPEPEPAPELEREDVEVHEYGYSTFSSDYFEGTRAPWAVLLVNPNERLWIAVNTDIRVTLIDSDGEVLSSHRDTAAAIAPEQTVAFASPGYEDVQGVAEMRVQARTREWQRVEDEIGAFETTGVNLRDEDFGWTVTGAVTSSFERDLDDVVVVAVLRDGAGQIVGGDYGYLDFVPAAGDTSFQVRGYIEVDGVESAEAFVRHSHLSLARLRSAQD